MGCITPWALILSASSCSDSGSMSLRGWYLPRCTRSTGKCFSPESVAVDSGVGGAPASVAGFAATRSFRPVLVWLDVDKLSIVFGWIFAITVLVWTVYAWLLKGRLELVSAFLGAKYEPQDRHARRLDQVLEIYPSLTIYFLLIALACLLAGPRIFQGPGMHPKGSTWSYAILTMIILLAPAVMDGPFADGASSAFYTRLFLFLFIAVYGSVAVAVFDAFWPQVTGDRQPPQEDPAPA